MKVKRKTGVIVLSDGWIHLCATDVYAGADSDFLAYALKISKSHVYSLHKMSTVQVGLQYL